MDADRYETLQASLNISIFGNCKRPLRAKPPGRNFEYRFGTKEALIAKFDQLAELRNGIRHSRAVSEVIIKRVKRRSSGFGEFSTNETLGPSAITYNLTNSHSFIYARGLTSSPSPGELLRRRCGYWLKLMGVLAAGATRP